MPASQYIPLTGTVLPRYAGIATLMRLPFVPLDALDPEAVEIGLIGVPWDGGTTNRPGARHGPRQVRDASTLVRNVNRANAINPFALCACADLGDAPVNPADLEQSLADIADFYRRVQAAGIHPLSVGGDHLLTLPVLRGLATGAPLGLIHVDAHTDTADEYFNGCKYTHGTPFRRAIEEGLLDPKRIVQIGIRGALYADATDDWGVQQGIRIIDIDEFNERGVAQAVQEARKIVGDQPSYLSFDIDALDPAFAPGTGTPEIGGMTSYQAQQLIRGLRGFNLVGADVVEVSPPFDPAGNTALVAATLLFEILCVLAENVALQRHQAGI